jgi:DNA-binding CsgD family transcriptional regulator
MNSFLAELYTRRRQDELRAIAQRYWTTPDSLSGQEDWHPGIEALISALRNEFRGSSDPAVDGGFDLTPSELRVTAATIRGLDTKAVSRQLFMSVKTVEHHLTNIYRKMNVRTRQELAAQVIGHLLAVWAD